MSKKVHIGLMIVLITSMFVSGVSAQSDGSIRGTVYQDTNVDGVCVGTGEPTLQGVPIKFVSTDGQYVIRLESGDDGTYGLVAVGLGTWTASIEQDSGWVITSENDIQVHLSTEQRVAQGVDFCVVKAGTSGAPTTTATPTAASPPATPTVPSTTPPGEVLPDSGAPIAPILVLALATGSGLIAIGAGLEWHRRRNG